MIRQTAAKFLVEHNSVTYGRGYRARQNIPEKTALAFYTGTLEKAAGGGKCALVGRTLLLTLGRTWTSPS